MNLKCGSRVCSEQSRFSLFAAIIHRTTNLVFLQKFEFDGHVTAQPLVFLSVDLVLLLGHLDAYHGGGVSRAQAELLQV